ncbi:D-alanyl-D-alanine carboxypeptidase, partial [bacterium]|nr:D-alanyl-D-alanine carboxypeptidase [bacterium]
MLASVSLLLALAFPGAGAVMQPPNLPPPPIVAMPTEAPPRLDAASWMLWSVERDAELWSGNPDQVRAPASVTKVMTALLVVERGDLNDYTTVSAIADQTPIGFAGQPEVVAGETWRVGDLFDFLVVKSGNDVAATLAEYVAGSEKAFADLMNQRAAELGMTNTHFA